MTDWLTDWLTDGHTDGRTDESITNMEGNSEFTMNIHREQIMINRYSEFVNDSNTVYNIKADADIVMNKIMGTWYTYYFSWW